MRLRPYREKDDYRYLERWIKDERTHALWCANTIPYPLTVSGLESVLETHRRDWGDCAYVFTEDSGKPVGFLSYSINEKENSGFVKFVIVDVSLRGKGYGTQMMDMLLLYAYTITGVSRVRLNVFDCNQSAKRCYEKAGFTECETTPGAFVFGNEAWGRCLMMAERENPGGAASMRESMSCHSKIVILRGNSGSGKTTVAKALQRKFGRGTLLVSQDCLRREMLWVKDGEGNKAISLLTAMMEYGYENCETVILEGILEADVYRELFLHIQNRFSGIYAYYYDLPFSETLKRHRTKPNCNDFGEEDMRRWWKEKDMIGIIPEKILTGDMSFEETVEMIFREVTGS